MKLSERLRSYAKIMNTKAYVFIGCACGEYDIVARSKTHHPHCPTCAKPAPEYDARTMKPIKCNLPTVF